MKTARPRRLRDNGLVRKLVRETRLSADALVYPIFIREGKGIVEDITSMEGQKRYTVDKVSSVAEEMIKNGVRSFMLFGVPDEKDEIGSGAYDENGIVQQAIRTLKKEFGQEAQIITDVCLCEYTSHGHCGLIRDGRIENDSSRDVIAKTALSHAQAGCDMVAPSDMMDGRVGAIRKMLDDRGFQDIPVMSYAAKYASAFYGPFREAAACAPQFGDRKTYQMDWHNAREAVKEALLDIEEGADIIMVKPAMSYLDIITKVREQVNVPVAAYSVSGEYAMIKAAARQNLIREYELMCEMSVGIFRAGADILITYFAKELAGAITKGDIG